MRNPGQVLKQLALVLVLVLVLVLATMLPAPAQMSTLAVEL
jgi:hypothetical protein